MEPISLHELVIFFNVAYQEEPPPPGLIPIPLGESQPEVSRPVGVIRDRSSTRPHIAKDSRDARAGGPPFLRSNYLTHQTPSSNLGSERSGAGPQVAKKEECLRDDSQTPARRQRAKGRG